jgi:hypothetical protein
MQRCQVRSGATRASLRRTAPSARECGNPTAQCRAEEVHRPSFVGLALVTGATVCVRAAAVAGVSDHETLPSPRQAVSRRSPSRTAPYFRSAIEPDASMVQTETAEMDEQRLSGSGARRSGARRESRNLVTRIEPPTRLVRKGSARAPRGVGGYRSRRREQHSRRVRGIPHCTLFAERLPYRTPGRGRTSFRRELAVRGRRRCVWSQAASRRRAFWTVGSVALAFVRETVSRPARDSLRATSDVRMRIGLGDVDLPSPWSRLWLDCG